MRILRIVAFTAVAVCAAVSLASADSSNRIYGKLTTVDGDVFEGLIRWDKNEASWVDFLNGHKERSLDHRGSRRKRYRDRKKTIKILGLKIRTSRPEIFGGGKAQCGIRFGHITALDVIDDDAVLITLKTGETLEMQSYSSDIGEGIRELVIEDRNEGEIEFDWEDVERIEFQQADPGLKSNFGERLYGTVITDRGDEFTGYLCWDIDEMFTEDILDGKHKHRKRKIEFGKIEWIERRNSSSATVMLKKGDELVLRGTNDVDDSNRGIVISDPNLGSIVIEWDDFERVDFREPPRTISYDDFDGGRRLEGTVYSEDGEAFTGIICWDDDEEYTWELLDGDYHDIEFDIEFTHIKEIKRKGYSSSIVTLWDGRSFRLDDSNDVDDDNKGIFVKTKDGDEVELEWDEFERVEFAKP
jgi:hypothetical protein